MPDRDELVAAARAAMAGAYAPYSNFRVGAALRFDDGEIVTGTNIENASYGLSLCAETVAVANAMAAGRRGGLAEVAAPVPITATSMSPPRRPAAIALATATVSAHSDRP